MSVEPSLSPLPVPPPIVARAIADLARVRQLAAQVGGRNNEAAIAELEAYGDLELLPRPWEPATFSMTSREQLWDWLEDVAAWINREYSWRVDSAIPACWTQHPHLAHEIAALAATRYEATLALSPEALEEWHRWTLPSFLDRMKLQIGNGCTPGRHTPWPAQSRCETGTLSQRIGRRGVDVPGHRTALA